MSIRDARKGSEPASAAVTGRVVAFAAASDFMKFFYPWLPFSVEVRVGAVSSPCVKRDKTGTYIFIPREMAEDQITTSERLLFHLLMTGHEIAHLVHRHIDGASTQLDEDYRSLELWADFYGTKVALTLLTFGEKILPITRKFWPTGDPHQLLSDLGGAVGVLVDKVYREHKRYPPKLERAGLVSNGAMAFFRLYYGTRFDVRFYYSVPMRILAHPSVRELIILDGGSTDFSDDPIKRSLEWHRRAQGDATSITPGFLPHVLTFLHTTFDQSDAEIAESRRIRLEELTRSGLLDDLDLPQT